MLVPMMQDTFHTLDDETLGWVCIEPTHRLMLQNGPANNAQLVAQLTQGQHALLLFQVLHQHAGTEVDEFYGWMTYLLTEPQKWAGIAGALRWFGDEAMLQLLNEVVQRLGTPDAVERCVGAPKNLEEDAQLSAAVSRLYARYREIIPATLLRVSTYIRTNPQEFVHFEDDDLLSDEYAGRHYATS
ncbi:MAG: hypothetical protein H0X37_11710 [Herpetosiphonaceae bacterium]|nr:hypothetical protein [Herpetosiphonaceae bacterium]